MKKIALLLLLVSFALPQGIGAESSAASLQARILNLQQTVESLRARLSSLGVAMPNSLKVVSPNGGEVYEVEEKVTIAWGGDLKLMGKKLVSINLLDKNNGFVAEITKNVDSSLGSYLWRIPESLVPAGTSGGFKIEVVCVDKKCLDRSDATFSVENDYVGPQEKVLLNVETSSNNPGTSVITVEEDEVSDAYGIFAAAFETEEDVKLKEVPVKIHLNTVKHGLGDVIHRMWLEIDGEEYGNTTYFAGEASDVFSDGKEYVVMFDTDGAVLSEGEEQDILLVVEFEPSEDYPAGTLVKAEMTEEEVRDIRLNDRTNVSMGTAEGNAHMLMGEGIMLEGVSTNSSVIEENGRERGVFEILFDVTAFEADAYIPRNAAHAIKYGVFQAPTDSIAKGAETATLISEADVEGGFYVVEEGDTRWFKLKVVFDPSVAGMYRVGMGGVRYSLEGTPTTRLGNTIYAPVLNDEDFRTDYEMINVSALKTTTSTKSTPTKATVSSGAEVKGVMTSSQLELLQRIQLLMKDIKSRM